MSNLTLKTVTRTQGNNAPLKDGMVTPKTFAFAFEEVDPLIAAFRRMVRGGEFDICEMAITTYICAKAYGKPMTAIPVFIVRAFHHGAILVNTKAGIRTPKDLEGKKVGVNRGYTVTTGVWARGVLQQEFGVDLGKITWVLSGDEHVAEYVPPANVVPIEKGKTIAEMLAAGELAGAIGVEIDHPDVRLLIPDALEAGLCALATRGHGVEVRLSRSPQERANRQAHSRGQAASARHGDHRRSASLWNRRQPKNARGVDRSRADAGHHHEIRDAGRFVRGGNASAFGLRRRGHTLVVVKLRVSGWRPRETSRCASSRSPPSAHRRVRSSIPTSAGIRADSAPRRARARRHCRE